MNIIDAVTDGHSFVFFMHFALSQALIYWDIEEDEISDCCLAHYNAEKSKRIVPQQGAKADKETYLKKTMRYMHSGLRT